jgi:hypothetical protein
LRKRLGFFIRLWHSSLILGLHDRPRRNAQLYLLERNPI